MDTPAGRWPGGCWPAAREFAGVECFPHRTGSPVGRPTQQLRHLQTSLSQAADISTRAQLLSQADRHRGRTHYLVVRRAAKLEETLDPDLFRAGPGCAASQQAGRGD
jgi:hypothetical protein